MLPKAICFFAPLSIAYQIEIGSQIFAAELLLPILATAMFLTRKQSKFNHDFMILVKLAMFYFVSQIFSDLWNGSEYEQYSRGWARIALFLVNIIGIYIIIDNKRSHLVLFCIGFALGRIWVTYSGFEGDAIPWKIGLAKPVALLTIVFCIATPGLRGSNAVSVTIMLLALGIFDIMMDFRSHGAVLIIVAVLLMSSVVLRKRSIGREEGGLSPFLRMSFASLVAAVAAFQIYVYAADSGWLSEGASRKYEAQVRQADVPLLVAGRSETLVYFEAIFGSIIIGHGSWPRDRYYAEQLANARVDRGLSKNFAKSADNSIPIHSHIFGGWIEAGIVGGLFWFNVVILIIKSLVKSSAGTSHMRPLYMYAAVLLLWDVFFSPFSGFRRIETAFLIVIVLRSLLQRRTFLKVRTKRRTRKRRMRHKPKSCSPDTGGAIVQGT